MAQDGPKSGHEPPASLDAKSESADDEAPTLSHELGCLDLITRGHGAMDAGDLESALTALRRARTLEPLNIDAWIALAEALRRDGQSHEAIALSQAALDRDPDRADALITCGLAHAAQSEPQAAMRCLREAIRLRPDMPDAHRDLGTMQLQLGQVDAAIFSFRSAVGLGPESAESQFQLGMALSRRGAAKAAAVHLESALRLSESGTELHSRAKDALRPLTGPMPSVTVSRTPTPAQGLRAAVPRSVVLRPPEDLPVIEPVATPEAFEDESAGSPRARETSGAAAFTGSLEMFSVPNLLEFLRVNRASGALFLRGRRGTGEVRLRRGLLVGAQASRAPRLGDILVRTGQMQREALDHLIAVQRAHETVESLGALLLETGDLDEAGLRAAIVAQIHAAIADLIEWESGHFSFDKMEDVGVDAAPGGIHVELSTEMVLLEAVRRADERRRDT